MENSKVQKEILRERLLNSIENNLKIDINASLKNILSQGEELDSETLHEIKLKSPSKYEFLKRAFLDTQRSNKNNSPLIKENTGRKISITSDTTTIKNDIKIHKLNIHKSITSESEVISENNYDNKIAEFNKHDG